MSPELVTRMAAHAYRGVAAAESHGMLRELAAAVHLPVSALREFGAGFKKFGHRKAWLFSERDDQGRIVGIVRRDVETGEKCCVPGGCRGLIYSDFPPPAAINDPAAPLYFPEGHTDTIALHAAGCLAIGRPAARPSTAVLSWILAFLREHRHLWQAHPIVVVGDNDDAGESGAEFTARAIATAFRIQVVVAFPPAPHKDMRDWLAAGTFVPGWPIADGKGVRA